MNNQKTFQYSVQTFIPFNEFDLRGPPAFFFKLGYYSDAEQ